MNHKFKYEIIIRINQMNQMNGMGQSRRKLAQKGVFE